MKEGTISILHISDLHKKQNDNYQNLFQSLKDDANKYTSSLDISKPKIIVVTGDIIGGGTHEEIKRQYSDVNCFLNKIIDFFLDGNKNNIILVPGNHDINWNVSKSSMEKDNSIVKNKGKINISGSETRWSWEDTCFYKITDENKYNERMNSFIDFYNNFYSGDKIYSKDPDEQYQIFDIQDFDISFVAYNSCHLNDHLNLAGCINPNCITRSSTELENLHRKGRLLVGVWHHNVSGLPYENNYMSQRVLHTMIDKNIQIGLFGHQHFCHVINELKNIIENKKMLLVSAGTLYGGNNTLPYGTKRQYNLITLTARDNELLFKIYLREDKSPILFEIPDWGEGGLENSLISSWSTPLVLPEEPNIEAQLDAIFKEIEVKPDNEKIIKQLTLLDINNHLVREALLQVLDDSKKYDLIYKYYFDPKNIREAILLMSAVLELGDTTKIIEVTKNKFIINNIDAAVKEQLNILQLFLKEKKYGAD